MSDLHIDDFYSDAARVLATLYSVFPRPFTVFAEDICGPDEPDEYGVHSHRHQACFATMIWLGEEGFIRYHEPIKQEALDQATLTGRCFSALHAQVADELPDGPSASLAREQSSLIYRLNQAIKRRDTRTVRSLMETLIDRMVVVA